jgi:hypothetical protein
MSWLTGGGCEMKLYDVSAAMRGAMEGFPIANKKVDCRAEGMVAQPGSDGP